MAEDWKPDDDVIERTDTAMRKWRQGHVFAEGHTAWVSLRDEPHTGETAEIGGTGQGVTIVSDDYLVVVSQTCDIVKTCWAPEGGGHPFVQVSPVVTLEGVSLVNASNGRMPRYAYLPGLGANCFADLSRCTTVEKTVLAKMGTPLDGCSDDETRARFATALAEQRSRFAFPDGTEKATKKLRKRLESKHDGEGDESALIRMVREVRVKPLTEWENDVVEVELVFVVVPSSLPSLDPCASEPIISEALRTWTDTSPEIQQIVKRLTVTEDPDERNHLWQMLAQGWANLGDQTGTVRIIGGQAVSTTEYPMQRMWSEPRLSFDHLSADSQG